MCCTGGEGRQSLMPNGCPHFYVSCNVCVPTQECELECARDQLQSLLVYEGECGRKDRVMKELRKELAAYKQNSHSKDIKWACSHSINRGRIHNVSLDSPICFTWTLKVSPFRWCNKIKKWKIDPFSVKNHGALRWVKMRLFKKLSWIYHHIILYNFLWAFRKSI